MADWIPDRPLGYTKNDYAAMPLSQKVCVRLRKSFLTLGITAGYICLVMYAFSVIVIGIAIIGAAHHGFGLIGAVICSLFVIYGLFGGKNAFLGSWFWDTFKK